MPSHNAKGRSKKGVQYVPIPYTMAHSPAWRSLGGAAVKVYVELRSRFNGNNNGDLSLSYDHASALLELSKSTVKRAFEELEAKGFIKRTSPGQWYGRKAATWAVTDRALKGHPPTRDWQNWHKRQPHQKTENGTLMALKSPLRATRVPKADVCVPPEYPSGGSEP